MATLLAWLVNSLRPRGGWLPLLLTLVVLLCAPGALGVQGASAEIATLILLVALALPLGLWLARSRLSGTSAAILGALLGLLLVVLAVGRILPPLSLLWGEVRYAARWLGDWLHGEAGGPLPLSTAAGFVWQRLGALGTRLWWWGQAATSNASSQDPIMRQLLTAALVWSTSLFGTWQIYRCHSALRGLAPTGTIVAVTAFNRGGMAMFAFVVAIFGTVWLAAICRLWSQRARWDRQGTGYPGDLGLELLFSYGPWITMILIVAALFPVVYPRSVHRAFWEVAHEPWEDAIRVAERYLGPIKDDGIGGLGVRPGEGGGLPNAHLLTGGPDLSDRVVLYVTTNDPPPPQADEESEPLTGYPRRYWRARTLDTYTGQGWVNGSLESQALLANQVLDAAVAPGDGTGLFQQFQRLASGDTLIYAANAPYQSDSPLEAWQRAPGDLAFLTGDADIYTILSHTPQPTALELRASSPVSGTLPPEIAERYLALPETVPQRVLDLARDVADDAPTRYDRALAIEHYLRAYVYTLDLPEPPDGRDLVDYFLFEWQEGYCDYYASAMVVMARAVGVPARLASGYAQGRYDFDAGHWVVTEQDGHSWVEVYFDRYGWVEFEPTAGQPALDRPGGQEAATLSLPPLPPRAVRWWQQVPWGLAALVAAALLLGAAIVWLWRPRPALTAVQLVRDRQDRLLRWGARLGHPLRDGQTASEYAQTLGQALRALGSRARWSQARQSGEELPPAVEQLSGMFVRAQYSPEPVTDREAWHVRELWTRLRRHLWMIWLASGLRKDRGDGGDMAQGSDES